MKKQTKILSLLLALAMIISMIPTLAFASVEKRVGDYGQKGSLANVEEFTSVSTVEDFQEQLDEDGKTLSNKKILIADDMTWTATVNLNNSQLYIPEDVTITVNSIYAAGGSPVIGGSGMIKRGQDQGNVGLIGSNDNGEVLTIYGVTIDGGEIWGEDEASKLGRATTGTGVFLDSAKKPLIKVSFGGVLYMDGVTVQNHHGKGEQSAAILIRDSGTLYVENSVIRNNSVDTTEFGVITSMCCENYIEIINTELYGNYSNGCGAIYYQSYSDKGAGDTINFKNCDVHNNGLGSGSKGGTNALFYARNGTEYNYDTLIFEGCKIHDNDSGTLKWVFGDYGIGEKCLKVILSDTEIKDNTNMNQIYCYDLQLKGNCKLEGNAIKHAKIGICGALGDEFSISLTAEDNINAEKLVAYAVDDYVITDSDLAKLSIPDNKLAICNNAIYLGRTITFHSNFDPDDTTTQIVPSGIGTLLNDNEFSREDFTFVGWGTNSNDTTTTYVDGESIKTTEDKELYAIWSETSVAYEPKTSFSDQIYTYDGSAKAFVLADEDSTNGLQVSYEQGGTLVESPKEAGIYDVKLHKAEEGNQLEYYATIYDALVINKALVTITAEDKSGCVCFDMPAYTVTVVREDDKELGYEGVASAACSADGTKAGSFDIVPAKVTPDNNHAVKYVNGTLTLQDHVWVDVADDAFKKNDASYDEPLTYFKSCAICDNVKNNNATFAVGDAWKYVESIDVVPENVNVAEKYTTTLRADVLPLDVHNRNVTWSSSNDSIATVSAEGVVTGVKAGTATITATANDGSGKSDSCTVTVVKNTTGGKISIFEKLLSGLMAIEGLKLTSMLFSKLLNSIHWFGWSK